jgi:hypothetical protein
VVSGSRLLSPEIQPCLSWTLVLDEIVRRSTHELIDQAMCRGREGLDLGGGGLPVRGGLLFLSGVVVFRHGGKAV